MEEIKPLMTRQDFAQLTKIGLDKLRRMISDGEIEMVGSLIPAREYYKLINPQPCQEPDAVIMPPATEAEVTP